MTPAMATPISGRENESNIMVFDVMKFKMSKITNKRVKIKGGKWENRQMGEN